MASNIAAISTSVFEKAIPAAKDLCENNVMRSTVKIICINPAIVIQKIYSRFIEGNG